MKTLESVFDVNYDSITDDAIQKLKENHRELEVSFERDTMRLFQTSPLSLENADVELIHKIYSLQGCSLLQIEIDSQSRDGIVFFRNDDEFDFKGMNIEMLCGVNFVCISKIKNMNILQSKYTINFTNYKTLSLENVTINCKEIYITERIISMKKCNINCNTVVYWKIPPMSTTATTQEECERFVENHIGWKNINGWNFKKLKTKLLMNNGETHMFYFVQHGKNLKCIKMSRV